MRPTLSAISITHTFHSLSPSICCYTLSIQKYTLLFLLSHIYQLGGASFRCNSCACYYRNRQNKID